MSVNLIFRFTKNNIVYEFKETDYSKFSIFFLHSDDGKTESVGSSWGKCGDSTN